MPNVRSLITQTKDAIFDRYHIERHPLFDGLTGGSDALPQQQEVAIQIYHVVRTFPRFLAALLSTMTDYRLRMPLVENLFEEHGRLNDRFVHVRTYERFLGGIGVSQEMISVSRPIVGVEAYNRAMIDLCRHHPQHEALAAMGIVEEIVARVSPGIASAAATFNGERNDGDLLHFTSHAVLDVSHANELYDLVAELADGSVWPEVLRGFELGMYYHHRLYDDIYRYVTSEWRQVH